MKLFLVLVLTIGKNYYFLNVRAYSISICIQSQLIQKQDGIQCMMSLYLSIHYLMIPCHEKLYFSFLSNFFKLSQVNLESLITKERFQSIIGTKSTCLWQENVTHYRQIIFFLNLAGYIFLNTEQPHTIFKIQKSLLINHPFTCS